MRRPPRIVAASIAGQLFRLVPYRHRQSAALFWSRFVPFAERYRAPFETRTDARARIVLRAMGYANVLFPNNARVIGIEKISGPAMIVTTHLFLNSQLVRSLIERGHRVAVPRMSPSDPPRYGGTNIPIEDLLITPTIFVHLRQRLAAGEIAYLNIDGTPEPTPWEVHGYYLSGHAVAFALRLGVPVWFAATRIIEGKLVCELWRAAGQTLEAVMGEFLTFMDVARRG